MADAPGEPDSAIVARGVPPAGDAAMIQTSLRTLLTSLQKVEQTSSLSDAELLLSACREIRSAATKIRTSAQNQWNAYQEVGQLPNEVLHEILLNALVDNKVGYIRRPTSCFVRQQALRRISSHWNQIITSSPYFWNTLCCIDFRRKRFEIALEKSRNVGLHITCRSSNYCRRFAERMSAESHRWISLDILYDTYWDDHFPLPTPRLNGFRANGQGWEVPTPPTEHAQGLSLVLYHATGFQWNTPLPSLYALELTGVSPAPAVEKLLDIVAVNPRLERLVIDAMSPHSLPATTNLRKVTAPNLRYIGFSTLSTSETSVDFITHLIVAPTTYVHIRIYAGEAFDSIPGLINKLIGYLCDRTNQLDESFAVGIRIDPSHRKGVILECPPTNPILKVRFGWWTHRLSVQDGLRAIVDVMEPAFRGKRELCFSPENTSFSDWSLSKIIGPWGQRLPHLSHLAIPSSSWTLDTLTHRPPEGEWAYPNLQHLRLLGSEWQSGLVDLARNRQNEPTVKTLESLVLERINAEPQSLEELKALVGEVLDGTSS